MTFREVTWDEIVSALGDAGEDPILGTCVTALQQHPRPSYTIDGTPAMVLRETLEVKYRLAASRGKRFIGDEEFLLRLQEMGSEPVAGVSAHHAGKSYFIYVTPSALKPVGAVIMEDSLHDGATSG